MQRWEYLQHDEPWPKIAGEMVDLPKRWDALEITLNGWELVSTVRTPSGTITSLFKRPFVEKTAERAEVPAFIPVPVSDRKRKGGRA